MQSTHECLAKDEVCTNENKWGQCYVSDIKPVDNEQGPPLTACVSRISELRARAAAGEISRLRSESHMICCMLRRCSVSVPHAQVMQ